MKAEEYLPAFEFTLREFYEHFSYYHTAGPMSLAASRQYFLARYPQNTTEACFKLNRFMAVVIYIQRYGHQFEEFVVLGENRKALIKDALIETIARYYIAIPEKFLRAEPEKQWVITTARATEAASKSES